MKSKLEVKDLKSKDIKALSNELVELNKKLFQLRFKLAFRNLKNFNEIRATRKKIARVSTILNEKLQEEITKKEEKKS